jgi:hypothetical protein
MGGQPESGVWHWVVQRNARTGALITYRSFADYADALRHKAELEVTADPLLNHVSVLGIESLSIGEVPKSRIDWKGGGFS